MYVYGALFFLIRRPTIIWILIKLILPMVVYKCDALLFLAKRSIFMRWPDYTTSEKMWS